VLGGLKSRERASSPETHRNGGGDADHDRIIHISVQYGKSLVGVQAVV
jgi:hypothetical protein